METENVDHPNDDGPYRSAVDVIVIVLRVFYRFPKQLRIARRKNALGCLSSVQWAPAQKIKSHPANAIKRGISFDMRTAINALPISRCAQATAPCNGNPNELTDVCLCSDIAYNSMQLSNDNLFIHGTLSIAATMCSCYSHWIFPFPRPPPFGRPCHSIECARIQHYSGLCLCTPVNKTKSAKLMLITSNTR